MRSSFVCLCVTAVVLTQARPANAQIAENAEAVASKHVGVGYKIGNGLGFVGADLIISPVDHVTLDLQANWFSASSGGTTANGYGIAPAVQFHLFKGQVSSLGGGIGYLGNVHATNGVETVEAPGGTHFNLETGLRYMFF
jgi:hypothetical protein